MREGTRPALEAERVCMRTLGPVRWGLLATAEGLPVTAPCARNEDEEKEKQFFLSTLLWAIPCKWCSEAC